MIDPALFKNLHLQGGFVIADVQFTNAPMVDALEGKLSPKQKLLAGSFICSSAQE